MGVAACPSLGPHSKDYPQGSDHTPEILIIGQVFRSLLGLELPVGSCGITLEYLAGRWELGVFGHGVENGKIRTP